MRWLCPWIDANVALVGARAQHEKDSRAIAKIHTQYGGGGAGFDLLGVSAHTKTQTQEGPALTLKSSGQFSQKWVPRGKPPVAPFESCESSCLDSGAQGIQFWLCRALGHSLLPCWMPVPRIADVSGREKNHKSRLRTLSWRREDESECTVSSVRVETLFFWE